MPNDTTFQPRNALPLWNNRRAPSLATFVGDDDNARPVSSAQPLPVQIIGGGGGAGAV